MKSALLETTADTEFLRKTSLMLLKNNIELQEEMALLKGRAIDADQIRLGLEDRLTKLNKMMFGKSSEKRSTSRPGVNDADLLIHNQPPVPEPLAAEKQNVPEQDVIHDLVSTHEDGAYACVRCGSKKIREISGQYEESCEITVIERSFKRIRHKRKKYACRDCEMITTAAAPVKLNPKSEYSIDFAVAVAIDKFLYHLPLERQRRRMESLGLTVDVKTLYLQTEALAEKLSPITARIRLEILNQPLLHIDESPLKILHGDLSGYVWNICNAYGSYYRHDLSRGSDIASQMIGNYDGAILSDGLSAYQALKKARRKKGLKLRTANCWAHVRRRFIESEEDHPEAIEMVELIGKLYEIDHQAKDLKHLQELRTSESKIIVDQIKEWIHLRQNKNLATTLIGQAFGYTLKLWEGLTLFLTDANIPLDNNAAERSLRTPVMGRNNYHGFRTAAGARVGMTYFTLIETCKLMRLSPETYLKDMALRVCKNVPLETPYEYAMRIRIA